MRAAVATTLIAAFALEACAPQTPPREPTSVTTTTSAQVSAGASTSTSTSASTSASAPGGPTEAIAPPPAATTTTSTTTPVSTQTDTNDSGGNQDLRAAGWISLGIGASSAVVALATSGMMLHWQSVRSSNCDANKVCNADGISANNNLSSTAGWNAAAWIVAGVGTGVGIFLVLTNPPRQSPTPPPQTQAAIGIGATGSGTGLNLRGTF